MITLKIEQPADSDHEDTPGNDPVWDNALPQTEVLPADQSAVLLGVEPLLSGEGLSAQLARFTHLNSELTVVLLGLSREVKNGLNQLNLIRSMIENKKGELKNLHDIEGTIAERDRLIEDSRLEKASFDRMMATQRAEWEAEKARHAREEAEYLENLRLQRQREEEEYRTAFQAKMNEELRIVRENNRKQQELLENHYREREQQLQQRGQEWAQLAAEMEQLISKINRCAQPAESFNTGFNYEALLTGKNTGSDDSFTAFVSSDKSALDKEEERQSIGKPNDLPLPEILVAERTAESVPSEPLFGSNPAKSNKSRRPSLKELLSSHRSRKESPLNLSADSSLGLDAAKIKC